MSKGKEKIEQDTIYCPVGRFVSDMEKLWGRGSGFAEHMGKSRVEFLKAIRSLVDERIEALEKRDKKRKKKAERIKVE